MKLTQLYNELEKKYPDKGQSLNHLYKNKGIKEAITQPIAQNTNLKVPGKSRLFSALDTEPLSTTLQEGYSLENLKIIGITGSKGKSSVAYLTHKYLESIGKKSILYSSIEIDSKASNKIASTATESPLVHERSILDILEEAIAYRAEYVVLEVNETAIASGIVKNVPFTIKALTNLEKNNSIEFMDNDVYVNSKKSFFKKQSSDDIFTSFFGMNYLITREELNELITLSDNEVITFGSKSACVMRNTDYSMIDYLVQDGLQTMKGIEFTLKNHEKKIRIHSSLLDLFNAINIALVIGMLDRLGVFNEELFKNFIGSIQIPGRNEVIQYKNRYLIIGMNMYPILENFKKCKERGEINQIKVIIGSNGYGFHSWDPKFQDERRVSLLYTGRKIAADYSVKTADYIYITSNDPAGSNPQEIANEIKGYVGNRKPSEIILDRKQAIRRAILDSKEGDLIFISERGNRRYFCKSATEFELFTDLEIVQEAMKDLEF